jgi:hypothetical protein
MAAAGSGDVVAVAVVVVVVVVVVAEAVAEAVAVVGVGGAPGESTVESTAEPVVSLAVPHSATAEAPETLEPAMPAGEVRYLELARAAGKPAADLWAVSAAAKAAQETVVFEILMALLEMLKLGSHQTGIVGQDWRPGSARADSPFREAKPQTNCSAMQA